MTLGEKIKAARLAKGYTQRQLAEILNAKNTTLCNWESGLNKPDADMIAKICTVLGVSANYLLGFTEDSTSQKAHQELIDAYDAADISTRNAVRRVLGLPDLLELNLINSNDTTSNKVDPDEIDRLLKERRNTAWIAAYGQGPIQMTYTDEELEQIEKLLAEKRKKV